MTSIQITIIVVVSVLFLGIIVFPFLNRKQLQKMPYEQQIRILLKQANKLVYWKNITEGKKGTLVYIKNKRKILTLPWILADGKMLCTKNNPLECWDYPEDCPKLNQDEVKQFLEELDKYNSKSAVKLYFKEN